MKPDIDETKNCDRCGRFGAVEIGDQWLCPDCLQSACSCCPEFEPDDADRRQSAADSKPL